VASAHAMTRQMTTTRLNPRSIPSAGMRGGLGRTLLTAFLLLSIVPLSFISLVAAAQARGNLEQVLKDKLITVSILTEAHVLNWVASQGQILQILADDLAADYTGDEPDDMTIYGSLFESIQRFGRVQNGSPTFLAVLLVDQQGHVLAAQPPTLSSRTYSHLTQPQPAMLEADDPLLQVISANSDWTPSSVLTLAQPMRDGDVRLVALLDPEGLISTLSNPLSQIQSAEISLVPATGKSLKLSPKLADIDSTDLADGSDPTSELRSMGIEAAFSGQSGAATYKNHRGETVIGAYRWLPQLNLGLLVEQPRDTALDASDDLAVVLIAATLAMVLLTAFIAALVARRITLPIVELTATAVQIAAGDLDQKVPATRRDEIGILARAFNVMTTKLSLLYEDLECKVKERTRQLEDANAEIRYQAMQLAISAEVGRVVTSILDREVLPKKVVELIRDCFQAYFVGIYFIDDSGTWAVLEDGTGGLGAQLKTRAHRVNLAQHQLIAQAVENREPKVCTGLSLENALDRQIFPHTKADLAIPLNIGDRTIGVLDIHSTHEDGFEGTEIMVLETLSRQVAVALENARVYQIERQAAEQLREVEDLRRRFLSNMSRELRTPLNNIIGFSRVMLKEIDGPITSLQRDDLSAIHDSGQQLLVLINDILDIAQIEAGAMELSIQPVEFADLAHSVIPTANALLQGRPIKFRYEISTDLPPVLADPQRLRQVLVKLLSNAAKFTDEGEISLRVWRDTDQVLASVSDTGVGIPDKDRDKVFEMFRQLPQPVDSHARGTGLGLAFSKEIVEMHGGKIWLESKEQAGTIFTFTLPITQPGDNHHSTAGNGDK
jgi:signal transduction histidine kinase